MIVIFTFQEKYFYDLKCYTFYVVIFLVRIMQIKNMLTAKSQAHHFLSLTNAQLSALVPRIRLYRVNYKLPQNSNGETDTTAPPVVDPDNPETEFYFHSHLLVHFTMI